MTASLEHAAARPSRASEVAEIHLAGVNESRKRCGLAPLTAAELAGEFADLDRLPQTPTKRSRRDAGNFAAARSGGPVDQAAIDSMWSGIVDKVNASPPASREQIGDRRASAAPGSVKPTRAETDSMWSSIAADLNAEAGYRTPARNRG